MRLHALAGAPLLVICLAGHPSAGMSLPRIALAGRPATAPLEPAPSSTVALLVEAAIQQIDFESPAAASAFRGLLEVGCMQSGELRRLIARVTGDPRARLAVVIVAQPIDGTVAHQRQVLWRDAAGALERLDATIVMPAGLLGVIPSFGHELRHVEEILETGQTLAQRPGPGVWRNGTGWESRAAQTSGYLIRRELDRKAADRWLPVSLLAQRRSPGRPS